MRLKNLLGTLPDAGASAVFTALFCLFFLVVCVYVYRKSRRPIYEYLSKLPLEDK